MSSVKSIRRVTRLLAAICLAAALPSPTLAQGFSIGPYPVRQYADENGVDLLSGAFTILSPGISIGGGDKGLTYQREVRIGVYRDSVTWNIAISGSTYTVGLAGHSEVFTLSGGVFTPVENNGSTLAIVAGDYVFTAADGTVATFTTAMGAMSFGNATGNVVTSVSYPNGRTLTFYHVIDSYIGGHGQTVWGRRLQDVTTNAGWHMNFQYANNNPTLDPGGWGTIVTVKGLNSSVDNCPPPASSCPQTGRPVLNIAGSTYTDAEGRVTTYTLTGLVVTGVKLPGSTSDDISITYTSNKVTSITRFGVTTTYGYVDAGGIRTVTVTRPGGATRVATFDLAKNVMLSDQDELGRTTTYQYDTNNRPTRVTLPEGNYTQITYDSRGNATEKRMVAKAGSGLADMVLTAGYDATCSNVKTCNQPNWTKDAKLNQTDYTYDSGHGGVLTITQPAPTVGANRPQARATWSRLDVNGTVSASGIFVPTSSSTCQTGTSPSCVGTADEVKATATFGYGYLPSFVSKGAGDNSLTATNAMTYDVIGNLTYVDGPLSGSADTVRTLYNQDREPVGMIGPDPDGAGSLPNRAVRNTYGSTGLVTKRDLGTTAGQSDAAWAAFSPTQTVDASYDANRRPITRKLSASGIDYALTQSSYDSRGRLQCTAVRMSSAAYGSLPSDACTLGTSGSYGSDRITKTNYDAASQVTSTQIAYGTVDQATERTLTYTTNGVVQTLLDAESNLTTYEYDGFDRLSKTRYPNTTKGSGTSSTTDYEQPTYDANSNVTSFRNRAAQTTNFTFDNLNRVTLKDLSGTEPDVTYAYDNLGRVTSATQTGNALAFTWDALSRRLTEVGPQGTATSEYDLANRRTKLTYPGTGLYVNTDYLVTGEATQVRENGAVSGVGVLATYAYDNLGNRTSLTFGNGVVQAFTFDPVSRLASLTNNLSGTTNDLTVSPIAYNPSSQITSTVRTGDAYAWTGHGNGSTAFTQNGLNQQISIGGSAATWDSKGNLTSEPQSGKTYGYSSENLLTSGTGGVTLGYDPALRLYQVVGAATTRFAFDGVNAIAEYNGSNALQRRLVFGPGADEALVQYEGTGATDRRFMSADERGSIISLTDSSGALLNINRYDEYGKPQTTNAGRFQYTGQMWLSEIGAYYYKARVYLPHLGIFAQTDPVGYADSPNLYAYVLDDPVNLVDPLGLEAAIVITGHRTPPGSGCDLTCFGGFGLTNFTPYNGVSLRDLAKDLKPECSESQTPQGCEEIVVTGTKPKPKAPPSSGPAVRRALFVPAAGQRDYCGSGGSAGVPDRVGGTDITGPCAIHDACYASSMSQQQCDQQLLNDIWDRCKKQSNTFGCYVAGLIYYYGLRMFGGSAYRKGHEN